MSSVRESESKIIKGFMDEGLRSRKVEAEKKRSDLKMFFQNFLPALIHPPPKV